MLNELVNTQTLQLCELTKYFIAILEESNRKRVAKGKYFLKFDCILEVDPYYDFFGLNLSLNE